MGFRYRKSLVSMLKSSPFLGFQDLHNPVYSRNIAKYRWVRPGGFKPAIRLLEGYEGNGTTGRIRTFDHGIRRTPR
jgi:hypothetical protein